MKTTAEPAPVLVFGAGAIGASVGGWLAAAGVPVTFHARPDTARLLNERGVTLYPGHDRAAAETVSVRAVDRLDAVPAPGIVVLAVKNYSLDGAAQLLRDAYGDAPLVVALQNGVDNQRILPGYFSKVIYGVVAYNAWKDDAVTVGWQKRGPLILGTPDNSLAAERRRAVAVLNRGVATMGTDRYQEAAHCKLVLNLTNSLTTLVDHMSLNSADIPLLQEVLGRLLHEGVRVSRAAGFHECRLGGMPGWLFIAAAAKLPRAVTRPLFLHNLRKMVMSSMAQDVVRRHSPETELDSINGHLLALAEKHGVPVPCNRAVYDLCREAFSAAAFQPVPMRTVWDRVRQEAGRCASA